jgi:hypothetical protein
MISGNPPLPASDVELLERFESLGDNCEFGLVQRRAGAEPLGFLRFNFTHFEMLLTGLKSGFGDLAEPGAVEVNFQGGEWVVRENRYSFVYHTWNTDPDYGADRLEREHSRWLKYMAAKFLEGIEVADRIYVRKGEEAADEGKIRGLFAELRRRGPVTLLWVLNADAAHPPGMLEILEDGLLRGWVRRLASYDQAHIVDVVSWVGLCRAAWALVHLGDRAALAAPAYPNLLPGDFGGWTGNDGATAQFEPGFAGPGGSRVMKHRLVADALPYVPVFGCRMSSGLPPEALCVASCLVWLPRECACDPVGMVLLGRDTLASENASVDLREVWQRVWVSTRLPADSTEVFPMLVLGGAAGSTIYSSSWQVHAGSVPNE